MKRSTKVKIVLTGGHGATTAIAVVEELIRRQKKYQWEIIWIGAKSAFEGKDVSTLESEVFPKLGVSIRTVVAGRLQRRFSFWTIPSLLRIPYGFFHALFLVATLKPKLIFSFGGFAAVPVVFAGWLLGIPVILHEQTTTAGRANRFSAYFVKKIALAREESRPYFPAKKTVVTGNPLLTQIAEIAPKDKIGTPPVVFVTSGSRGSLTINEAVKSVLPELLKKYHLIHQTGPMDFQQFENQKKKLPAHLSTNYEVYRRIDPMEIDNFYRQADVVIARAGANTVSEIIVCKRPAILIPIPWTYLDEQTKNARLVQAYGLASIIEQNDLTGKSLLKKLKSVTENWQGITGAVKDKVSPDIKASSKVVDLIEETLG
jgi:UDP-N-acetylglucosamine--N-acetylmuramyl-(pentapeptide) pyrophosphoryl-undecaprenol N-acetylglucosamine transferase